MVGSLIGCAGGQVSFAMPPRPGEVMTKAEALEFAAWIVAAAMPEDGEFERVLEEVRNT
jgi:hypothetical protein